MPIFKVTIPYYRRLKPATLRQHFRIDEKHELFVETGTVPTVDELKKLGDQRSLRLLQFATHKPPRKANSDEYVIGEVTNNRPIIATRVNIMRMKT